MATKAHDPCREKAADDEPIFTLRAQDISAPTVVRFWVAVQECLRRGTELGCSPEEMLKAIEGGIQAQYPLEQHQNSKLGEALATAEWMERWPRRKRKVAD